MGRASMEAEISDRKKMIPRAGVSKIGWVATAPEIRSISVPQSRRRDCNPPDGLQLIKSLQSSAASGSQVQDSRRRQTQQRTRFTTKKRTRPR